MKKPILVIGDIHNRSADAETILQHLKGRYRKAILLGDYFDEFGDTPGDAAATARWLARSVTEPDRIHLLGNHDLPYLFPQNSHLTCPRFTPEKLAAIEKELVGTSRERFQLAHAEDGWLFSHAGFAPEHSEGASPDVLAARANELISKLAADRYEPLLACGAGRGGKDLIGGITWLDWWCEFTPIPGLDQIVGHTPGVAAKAQLLRKDYDCTTLVNANSPGVHRFLSRNKSKYSSVNWCLDCSLHQVALVHPNRIKIVDAASIVGATNFFPI